MSGFFSYFFVIIFFKILFSPEFFNYEDLLENDNDANLEHAFRIAHEKLGIERLLDPEGKCREPGYSFLCFINLLNAFSRMVIKDRGAHGKIIVRFDYPFDISKMWSK